ncbi:MAG: enoyl-CoA hydratase/isomerase family protein [Proteobacteria bacterium]|nr:enoyl-CoA hydratase/isomerase family protein [Burkholderiales bacterium]
MDIAVPKQLTALSREPLVRMQDDAVDYYFGDQMSARFEPATGAVWITMCGMPRPCFNRGLLEAFNGVFSMLEQSGGVLEHNGERRRFHYVVLGSSVPGVFNLGGDLNHFKHMIEAGHHDEMRRYAHLCIEPLFKTYMGYHTPCTTVSLVQGQCLGGGFELALSSDVIIAERSATFGFPEILFGLFPGMGATSFLSRRVGERIMDRLMQSGEILDAEAAAELGVIDVVCDDGCGPEAVAELMRKRRNQVAGFGAMAIAKRRARNLNLAELTDITDLWADTAMQLTPINLKMMGRLVARQNDLARRQQPLAA